MNVPGEFRAHLLAVGAILLANAYLIRLMEAGVSGSWHWLLFFLSALMLGSSIYVGLVLGIGGGILVSIVIESIQSQIEIIGEARRRVVERSGVVEL